MREKIDQRSRLNNGATNAAMATLLADPEPTHASKRLAALFLWIFPALGVLSLLASCMLWSIRRRLWGDEVFSWIELSDPSLRHLLSAVTRLGGAGMPLFYLTAWPWARVFGLSDLSLRLYSSAGVCGAFLILVFALRRRFSAAAAFLGVGFGLFASLVAIEQNSEARGYGLYLFLSAAAVAQLLRMADTRRPGIRDYCLLALSQAGLVLGHVLGLIYAGLLLLALMAGDAMQRRFRAGVYACAMAGWLALLPWIPAIRASAAVGRPHGWIPVPSPGDLVSASSFWLFTGLYWQLPHLPTAVILAGWFCGVLVVVVLVLGAVFGCVKSSGSERAVVLTGLTLVAAPMVFYLVSVAITPIFLPRYLIPSTLGVSILGTAWAQRRGPGQGIAVIVLSGALLALPVATALLAHPQQLDVHRVDAMAAGRPVVCESQKDFLVMTRYTAHPGTPQYPLAWPTAVAGSDADSPDLRLMENYGREGYFAGQLPDAMEMLSRPSFLVLTDRTPTSDDGWFHSVVEQNPRFRSTTIGVVDASRRLVLVEHAG